MKQSDDEWTDEQRAEYEAILKRYHEWMQLTLHERRARLRGDTSPQKAHRRRGRPKKVNQHENE